MGPATIKAITPKPLYGAAIPEIELEHKDLERPVVQRVRNGFMLKPPAAMKVSYDSGVRNWFDPSLKRPESHDQGWAPMTAAWSCWMRSSGRSRSRAWRSRGFRI